MRKHKFKPGRDVRTLADAAQLVEAGQWLYWQHKPLHPGWLLGMPMAVIRGAAMKGLLKLAVLNEAP